jgi:transcription elongation factor Elf1/2-polyprenyl-3-methyl-5-hydroxy-6-metoxy-1,4-benzoquinol methylase
MAIKNKHLLHQSGYLVKPDGSVFHCPCCYSEKIDAIQFHFGNFDMVHCKSCGVRYLSPLPDADTLMALYNSSYYKDPMERQGYRDYAEDSGAIRKTYQLRLRKATHYLPSLVGIRNVHEVGCALVIGLEVTTQFFHCSVSGSDISDEAIRTCQEKGFTCYPSDSLGRCHLPIFPKVDLMYLFDVIEHLTDIPKFLAWAYSVCSDHAILVLTTPDMDSWPNRVLQIRSPSIKIPQHVVYFNTKTLALTLQNSFSLLASLQDFQYVTLRALSRRVLHVLGIPARELSVSLGNTLLLVPNGMRLYVFQKKK